MKNSVILKIGIIGITTLIILMSGCTSSSTTQTFSDGVMSFNYPDDFENITYSKKSNTNSSPMQAIGKSGNSYMLVIMAGKNISVTSPTELRDRSVSKNKNISGEVTSITTDTNPNGIVIEKITYKHPDSTWGFMLRYDDMYFKINGTVYAVSVYGPDFFNQQIANITNIIFQSIK